MSGGLRSIQGTQAMACVLWGWLSPFVFTWVPTELIQASRLLLPDGPSHYPWAKTFIRRHANSELTSVQSINLVNRLAKETFYDLKLRELPGESMSFSSRMERTDGLAHIRTQLGSVVPQPLGGRGRRIENSRSSWLHNNFKDTPDCIRPFLNSKTKKKEGEEEEAAAVRCYHAQT